MQQSSLAMKAPGYAPRTDSVDPAPGTGPHAEDLALVHRAVSGNTEAARALVDRIERRFRARARRMHTRAPWLRPYEDDLLQRFLVRLLQNDHRDLKSYAGQGPLDAWIGVVASRFLLRQAGILRPKPEATPHEARAIADPRESPEDAVARRATVEAVSQALTDLSDTDRALLALLYEQEVPAHVVGRLLGLSASGVRMRKMRLLKTLARKLKHLSPHFAGDAQSTKAPQ